MLYHLHEYNRALFSPATQWAEAAARMFSTPGSWLAQLPGAARVAAGYELIYRIGKRYEKPKFGIDDASSRAARACAVVEETALARPFCRLQRFKRFSDDADVIARLKDDPPVLVVAPLSGHHATLLRDTVRDAAHATTRSTSPTGSTRAWCRSHEGAFTLDDYVGYIREFIRHIGAERLHVIAVCQPAVPVLAAASLMAAAGEPRAAQPDPDGRADRHAPQPDPGQPLRHHRAAALVRDAPAARRCRRATRGAGAASIRDSCSTPASSP